MRNDQTVSGHSPAAAGMRPHRPDHGLARLAFWPLILIFAFVDTVLILGAMTVVLKAGPILGLMASGSIAFLAAYAMHQAGKQAREAHIWSRSPVAAWALGTLFIFIVGGLTWIRWNAGTLTDTSSVFEGSAGPDRQAEFNHHLAAVALIPMLCATGVIALLHGYAATTSVENSHARASRELATARDRLEVLEADAVRDSLAISAHEYELRQIHEQEERHLLAADALASEARAHAHRAIYMALNTPNASGMTDLDPDHPGP